MKKEENSVIGCFIILFFIILFIIGLMQACKPCTYTQQNDSMIFEFDDDYYIYTNKTKN